MTSTLTRSLIETFIRKKLIELKESPERITRNLVDMALNFSYGRFQTRFFELAQNILKDEKSTYYQIVQSLVTNVETEKLLKFSMNVGYNSFTHGAELIRKYEKDLGFNIPWCLTMELSKDILVQNPERYHKVINEGKAIGIYSYQIFTYGNLKEFLPIIDINSDCAFILYCSPSELTDELLDDLDSIHNIMLAVEYVDDSSQIFSILHSRKYLYSVYFYCGDYSKSELLNDELLCTLDTTNATFAIMLPDNMYSACTQNAFHKYALSIRTSPTYKILPWDFWSDTHRIDRIISDDSCFAWFDQDGYLFQDQTWNLFSDSLLTIFKYAFPKQGTTD